MIRIGVIKPHSSMDRQLSIPSETYYAVEFNNQKVSKVYPEGIFKTVSAKEMLATNQPEYFERNLEHILLIANYRKIKTVIATFAYSPLFKEVPVASSEEYISAYVEMNEVIKSVSKEMGTNLFDYANIFPIDKKYYEDGIHVNKEGAKLKARLFAEYIIENKLIPTSID